MPLHKILKVSAPECRHFAEWKKKSLPSTHQTRFIYRLHKEFCDLNTMKPTNSFSKCADGLDR